MPSVTAPVRTPAAATPAAFARAIALLYRRHGFSPDGALRQARITPAQLAAADGRITARQLEALTAAAMQELDDEGLGALGRPLPWGTYGLLARASLTSPDLRVALRRWCRHHGLVAPGVRITLAVTAGDASVRVEERVAMPLELRELSTAFLLRNVHGLACWYADSRIPLRGAALPFAPPPHADTYRHMFPGGRLRFSADQAEIRFDAGYLALPLRRDERAMRSMLQRALPLTVLQYRRDRLLVEQVRQLLANHPAETHNAEGVGRLLHVSPRTLHRQLKEEGSTLQQLKDEVRFERARDLLYRTHQPLKQIAAAVGFQNEKSFARAFRLWSGAPPGELRR